MDIESGDQMIMTTSSKVSVYITTCNRIEKLKRALASVQKQTYANIEIIVCDDASIDGTQEFMQDIVLNEKNIKYLRNETNKGACAARNLAIFSASGDFITGLDDDDEFTEDRISFFVERWDDKYSFICCNFTNVFEDGSAKDYYQKNKGIIVADYKKLLFDNIASNQVFTTTERLQKIGGFDIKARRLQDWDTWIRLSFLFGNFIKYPDVKYIMHNDHKQNQKRVSTSYSLDQALEELLNRNDNIYVGQDADYMAFIINCIRKKTSFRESVTWAYKKKTIKPVFKYLSNLFPIGSIKSLI